MLITSIIIVNHNTGKVLNECIDSLFRIENPGNFEVIVIDNFSMDDSKEIIESNKSKHKNITAVYTDSLISFSAANNLGIKKAVGEFILIMNPDIIFTEPVLDKLTGELNSNIKIAAITPALIGTDGKFQRNYFQRYPSIRQFIYYSSVFAKLFNQSAKRMNRFLENQDIDISTGKVYFTEQIPCAFFLIKRTLLNEIGLMNEGFILFFEDVDLSYRFSSKGKLAVDTSLSITHLGGSSFKTDDNYWLYGRFIVSMIYFFRKHYSFFSIGLLKLLVYMNSYLVLFLELLKKPFGRSDDYRIKKHKHLLALLKEEN